MSEIRSLSNRDLLALVAGEKASIYGGTLRDLSGETPGGIERRLGLGPKTARVLAAAFELGQRAVGETEERPELKRPEDAAAYLLPRYSTRPTETFGVLCFNTRHRLVHEAVVSEGCLTGTLVHPREVFRIALDARAACVVLFHNHPSGDPEPSSEDLALTRRLMAAGQMVGIEVMDHLVLGAGRFVSMKLRGSL